MLLVKLGGSVVTEKAHLRTPRPAAIHRLARELASVRQPLLVVHGAGSYGHILASRHRLNEGGSRPARRAAAASWGRRPSPRSSCRLPPARTSRGASKARSVACSKSRTTWANVSSSTVT